MKSSNKPLYDFPCEYCSGTVVEQILDREAIRYKREYVILENAPIGVCNQCGSRYFHVSVMNRVNEIGRQAPDQRTTVPVAIGAFMPSTEGVAVGAAS